MGGHPGKPQKSKQANTNNNSLNLPVCQREIHTATATQYFPKASKINAREKMASSRNQEEEYQQISIYAPLQKSLQSGL